VDRFLTLVNALNVVRAMRARAFAAVAAVVFVLSAAWLSTAQHPPIDAKVTVSKTMPAPLAYSDPAMRKSGTIEPAPGYRLYVIELAVGVSDIAAELETFRLVAEAGREYVATAAGGASNTLFPIARMELGQEMMQILPVEGVIAVTRHSPTNITVETTPRATLALLYEIPETATVIALKLPDGSVRSLR